MPAPADSDALDRIRLARTEGVGPITYRRLLTRYGTAGSALHALPGLAAAAGRSKPPTVPRPEAIAAELEALDRLGGRLIAWGDQAYPPLLAQVDDAPVLIAVQGDVSALASRAVAVVGSRNASSNGQRFAETLALDLAEAGLTIVSGMARGIDAAAHMGALRAGRTVACVAGGLDQPYPPEHATLQARIAERGAVVSEAPLGTAPQARHFPRRNRIIAALSLGVVVVEAAMRSGSLTTAHMANNYGRDVFAVPGSPLDPRCRGANNLIREGARITETAADVLEGLARPGLRLSPPGGLAEPDTEWHDPVGDSPAEQRLALSRLPDLLGPAPTSVDDLIRHCQLPPGAVHSALMLLELAGRVELLPGNRVALLTEAEASLRP